MGTVPTYRRGIAAGARTMLQNTGAVISIAFVLAIVTSSVPKDTLFKIFSGVATGPVGRDARAVRRQHAHRAVGARGDVGGRRRRLACCGRRGTERMRIGELARGGGDDAADRPLLRGDRAAAGADERAAGAHREYGDEPTSRACASCCGSRAARALAGRAARRDARRGRARAAPARVPRDRPTRPSGGGCWSRRAAHTRLAAGARAPAQGRAREPSRPSSTSAASASRTCCRSSVA